MLHQDRIDGVLATSAQGPFLSRHATNNKFFVIGKAREIQAISKLPDTGRLLDQALQHLLVFP